MRIIRKMWGIGMIGGIALVGGSACSHRSTGWIDPSSIQTITITDDSPASVYWFPINERKAKSTVMALLQGATPITVTIPEHPNIVFYAYMGPVQLHLTEKGGGRIDIYPASYLDNWKKDEYGNQAYHTVYIDNAVAFEENGKTTYYEDPALYDWLKNKKWQGAFTNQKTP